MTDEYKKLFLKATTAALDAGRAIMEIYASGSFDVEIKDDNSPLTRADTASHRSIDGRLYDTKIPLLSEEDAANHSYEERKEWERCWIVDPLDGTKEFIKRNGEFTVNIALVEKGVPVIGIVFVPAKDILYYNHPGEGAWRIVNASRLRAEGVSMSTVREQLPLQSPPQTFTIVGSRSHSSPETEAFVKEMEAKHGKVDFLAAGSSLKFCLVAEGKAHAYPRFAPTMEWDTAAGQAVLEAAGGTVITWPEKQPLRYNREQLLNPWFLATAPENRD